MTRIETEGEATARTGGRGLTRRRLLLGAGGAVLAGAALAWSLRSRFDGPAMTPDEAHRAALEGRIVLVDIRRPDEWAATGIGEGAHPLDMRRDDFIEALDRLVGGDRSRPVALICAAGVRSRRMAERLEEAGFENVIDIPEGMMGSRAGPGWLRRGLPVVRP